MTQSAKRLMAELSELNSDDRAEIAYFLLSTLEEVESADEVDEQFEAELLRRLEEIESGKVQGVPLEEVRARRHRNRS